MGKMNYEEKSRLLTINLLRANKDKFSMGKENFTKEEYLDKIMDVISDNISGESVKNIGAEVQKSLFRNAKVNRNLNRLETSKSNGLEYDLFYLFLYWSSIRKTNFNDYFVELFLADLRKSISSILDETVKLSSAQ